MLNLIVPSYEGNLQLTDAQPFKLVSGEQLPSVKLRYALYGKLNEARDNAILVCHALSGSARVGDWWPQLVGPNQPFDTSRYCVIGVNVIGSCYGSTGPCSAHPQKPGRLYGNDF